MPNIFSATCPHIYVVVLWASMCIALCVTSFHGKENQEKIENFKSTLSRPGKVCNLVPGLGKQQYKIFLQDCPVSSILPQIRKYAIPYHTCQAINYYITVT